MRGLFISIHLFSVGLSLVLVGIYAPLYWSIALYVLFVGSLIACESCKQNAKKSVKDIIRTTKLSKKEEGLVILSKSEQAIRDILKKKRDK